VGSDRGLRGGGIGRDGLRLLDGDIGRRLKADGSQSSGVDNDLCARALKMRDRAATRTF